MVTVIMDPKVDQGPMRAEHQARAAPSPATEFWDPELSTTRAPHVTYWPKPVTAPPLVLVTGPPGQALHWRPEERQDGAEV